MPNRIDEKENQPTPEKPGGKGKPEIIRPPEVEKPLEIIPPEVVEIKPPSPEIPTAVPPPLAPPKPPLPPPAKDPVLIQVEHILEEDLKDIYFDLPPKIQKKFQDKGDEIAHKIYRMISEAKAKAKKILNLIRSWLKIIPGINKFFLEQEAKIKTDKLMVIAEYEKEKKKQG